MKAGRVSVYRPTEAGSWNRFEMLRESPLHMRHVNRDEDDDDSRIDGLEKHTVRAPGCGTRHRDSETESYIRSRAQEFLL